MQLEYVRLYEDGSIGIRWPIDDMSDVLDMIVGDNKESLFANTFDNAIVAGNIIVWCSPAAYR